MTELVTSGSVGGAAGQPPLLPGHGQSITNGSHKRCGFFIVARKAGNDRNVHFDAKTKTALVKIVKANHLLYLLSQRQIVRSL